MTNFALLREAISIIEAIPDNVIDLSIVQNDCGTVCCAGGWLSHSQRFQELGLAPASLEGSLLGLLAFEGNDQLWDGALADTFGMERRDAARLFSPRAEYDIEEMYFPGTDKEIWLRRVHRYLDEHEEV